MPSHHLAQLNIGRLVAPLDDPRIAGFVEQLEPINRLAESSTGFVWRAKELIWHDDPRIIANMSVWESIEALNDYVFRSAHVSVLRDRRKWFERMDGPHGCLWWVPAGHRPTEAEAKARLDLYGQHGSTSEAFWFSDPHPAPSLC